MLDHGRARRKAKLAREAGADHTIDYKRENVGERVMALTKGGVDAVIEMDLTANAKLLPGVLRPRGTLVVYGTGPQVQIPRLVLPRQQHHGEVHARLRADRGGARSRAVADITRMLEANTLIHNVAATLSTWPKLSPRTRRWSRARAVGNVVMTIA